MQGTFELTKSRIGKQPIHLPSGVDLKLEQKNIHVKGKLGELHFRVHDLVAVKVDGNVITFEPISQTKSAKALTGTARAIVNNMIQGVSQGYVKELALVGVGYRAQVQGKTLILSLGYSHPIHFEVPTGITIETPSQTEVLIKGADKHLVGEVAAQIRRKRPPEPYKGKGVRYKNEQVRIKETKKK